MSGASLRGLEERVRPVAIHGTLTMEQAARAVRLNREIARFHAALAQARRIIGLAGVIDERLRDEIFARCAHLARAREAFVSELSRHEDPRAQA